MDQRASSPLLHRPRSTAFAKSDSHITSRFEELTAIRNGHRNPSPARAPVVPPAPSSLPQAPPAPPVHSSSPPQARPVSPLRARAESPPRARSPPPAPAQPAAGTKPQAEQKRQRRKSWQASGDLYSVLGVSKEEKPDNINRAFKKLSRKYHPDKRADKNDDTAFKTMSQAYAVLMNPERRIMYDSTGFTCQEEIMAAMARDPSLRPKMFQLHQEGKIKLPDAPADVPAGFAGRHGMAPGHPRWGMHHRGGMAGGMHGGMAGGMHGGMAGGMHGGMAGGMHGGMAGGMHGGMAGGMHGGMAGGAARMPFGAGGRPSWQT